MRNSFPHPTFPRLLIVLKSMRYKIQHSNAL
uniref:Uncharacterized protein n=1 Tax=Anguilla anguilla TaxID=7936 RepID=A0A0E9UK57_ANGAN